METSRDDFIIAIRSAFLKKGTQQRFSLLSLIFFSITFLVLGGLNFKAINYVKIAIKDIVYRSSFVVSIPEEFLKNNYIRIQSHLDLYDKNKKNKFELKTLKSKDLLSEFILLENKRLKLIIDDYLLKTDEVIAKVLSDKKSPFLRSVIINKGSKHNIKLGMIAIDGEYLVGKIIEVNYGTSRVLLLSDLNSKIPVIVEPKGILSILSGTGMNNGVIEYSKKENLIENVSIVYTSGSAGIIKSGIPVGKINKQNLNEKNIVNFFSDFSQLNFVKIVSFKKMQNK